MQAKRKNGFTLIELVIVIAILGILAGLAIPRFLDSRAQAQGAKLLGDLRTIDSAISIYQARTGSYPESLDILVTENYLASIPSSPTGSMLITTNGGSEKTYTSADAEYKLTDARATYSSSELNKGTVEQYLEGGTASGDGGTTTTNPSPATVGTWSYSQEPDIYKLGDKVFGSDGIIYETIDTSRDSAWDPAGIYGNGAWKVVGNTDGKAIALTDENKTGKSFATGITVTYNGVSYTSQNDGVSFDASNTSNWKQN
jgi:general secretion pathway protein G